MSDFLHVFHAVSELEDAQATDNETTAVRVLFSRCVIVSLFFGCGRTLRRCASAGTNVAKHGLGTCDYECSGDRSEICGGFLAMSTKIVGEPSATKSAEGSWALSTNVVVKMQKSL